MWGLGPLHIVRRMAQVTLEPTKPATAAYMIQDAAIGGEQILESAWFTWKDHPGLEIRIVARAIDSPITGGKIIAISVLRNPTV